MAEFQLNLIRSLVPSREQRRLRYRIMVGYLALSGLLLIGAVWLASARLVRIGVLREQARKLEQVYARNYEQPGGLAAGSARLYDQLSEQADCLRAVERHLAGDIRSAPIVRAFFLSLPAGVCMRRLELNREDQAVLIELLALGDTAAAGENPQDLLGVWPTRPELAEAMHQFSYLGSQIEGVGERSDTVWRFSARLKDGGG